MALPPPICWTQMSGFDPLTDDRNASSFPSAEIAGLKEMPLDVRRVSGRTTVVLGLELHQSQTEAAVRSNNAALIGKTSRVRFRVSTGDRAGVNLPESDSSFSSSSVTFRSAACWKR